MSSFLNISDQGDMEVAGKVKANAFIGDGSQLTGIESGKWSDGEGGIFYDGGNVAVGAPADHGKLVVRGDAGVSRLTEDEEAPVIANFIASSQQQKQGQLLVLGTDFPTPHSVALSSIQAQNSGLSFATRDADNNIGARLTITGAGNVGIGTTTPGAMLDVAGNIQIKGPNSANVGSLNFRNSDTGAWWHISHRGGTDNIEVHVRPTGEGNANVPLAMTPSGNVGIGTVGPGAKLEVAGTIKATGLAISGPLSSPGNEVVLLGIPTARTAPEDADLETVLVDRKTGKLYLQ